jgi:tetratricopeptide (TPR) repeat protein
MTDKTNADTENALGLQIILAQAELLIRRKQFEQVLHELGTAIEAIEKGWEAPSFWGKKYTDDDANEYRHFGNLLEESLYMELRRPTRRVESVPEDYPRLYALYGFACVDLQRYDEAEAALQKALKWNPVKVVVLFALAELYKKNSPDKYFRTTNKCLGYAYTRQDVAQCYRNIGYYYVMRQNYRLAAALFSYSLFWAESQTAREELAQIAQAGGKVITSPTFEECQRLLESFQIPVMPAARDIAMGLAEKIDKTQDIDTAKFLNGILADLKPKKESFLVKNEILKAKKLELVENIGSLLENIGTLDAYLSQSSGTRENVFAKISIQRGKCFVAVGVDEYAYKFYPSRFIGYENNSMGRHQLSSLIDGRETNRAITRVLKIQLITHDKNPSEWEKLELAYAAYCDSLGIAFSQRKRKYWLAIDGGVQR